MSEFQRLSKKRQKSVIGILSGTSVDAVDLVLIHIKGSGTRTRFKVIRSDSYTISADLKDRILAASYKGSGNVEDICRLNVQLGQLFGKCINNFIRALRLNNGDIDLIGSHGQTIHHLPGKKSFIGQNRSSTLQIGDPSVIAVTTGITTVGDFRMADVAAGGSGAPLVPVLDYLMFRDEKLNRLLVNIGGITNVTYLPKGCAMSDVIAFDTGPGNMLIDFMMNKLFGKKYDKDGKIARKGNVSEKLLLAIMNLDVYRKLKPPKSTGRETYGREFAEKILTLSTGMKKDDIISTVTEYTALSLCRSIMNFEVDEVIVSGGGASNNFLMDSIRKRLLDSKVSAMDHNGIDADNKEAVLFALLANEAVSGNKIDLSSVTGSKEPVILGKICQA